MKIAGSVALVTGANRGLGKAFVDSLFSAGATKVYAGAREPAKIADSRVIPVRLDVTSIDDVKAAATRCGDVMLLINNAGMMLDTPMLSNNAAQAIRKEMEVNVFGMQSMIWHFAPVLAKNGGGAVLNMLSVVSWFTPPLNATYAASKHAALAVSDAARIELKAQGTQVLGVYAGFIDTDMAKSVSGSKTSPYQVALRALEGVEVGTNHVLADDRAEQIYGAVRANPEELEKLQQEAWDLHPR